jgi:hypothetical protein
VPSSLASLFGGGGAAVGTGVALKAAAVVVAGAVIGSGGYEAVRHAPWRHPQPATAKPNHRPVATKAAVAGAGVLAREPARQAIALATAKVAGRHVAKVHQTRKTRAHTRLVGRRAEARAVSSPSRERAPKQHVLSRGQAKNGRAVVASTGAGHVKVRSLPSHQRSHPAYAQGRHVVPAKASKPSTMSKPPKPAKDVPRRAKTVLEVPGHPGDKKPK